MKNTQPEKTNNSLPAELKEKVEAKLNKYASFTKRWSFAYWGSVFGGAILSAFSALALQLDAFKGNYLGVFSNGYCNDICKSGSTIYYFIIGGRFWY